MNNCLQARDPDKQDEKETPKEEVKEEPKEEKPAAPSLYQSADSPEQQGSLNVISKYLNSGEFGATKDINIYYPQNIGVYPLVMFFHGFMLDTDFYEDSLKKLASHGFIVVAPQMYAPAPLCK